MAGEDKNTLTIFSSLAKNSVKFFSQNRFTSAFSLLFATAPTTTATAATRPCKRKKAARFLLPPSGFRHHRSGKPKSLRCSFQSSEMFFIICAMEIHREQFPGLYGTLYRVMPLILPQVSSSDKSLSLYDSFMTHK